MLDFKGRTVLVTGASAGIGRAIAVKFAENNANVIINYSGNEDGAKETERLCKEANSNARTLILKADVSSQEDVDRMFDEALKVTGAIDILINNAGITRDNLLLMMKPEDFDKVLSVNLYGTFNCMKKASKIMLKQKYGRIISMSSIVGVEGNPGQVNYAASKAGIIGMTKSLAKELARKGVTVNAIAPGMIETDMTGKLTDAQKAEILKEIPFGRMGQPEEVANAALFLASEEASYITGQVLGVDGGM